MGDQWFLERGMWTDHAADTLLGYAYMQTGVTKVDLVIDTDEANAGKSPKVTFKVKLEKKLGKRYVKMGKYELNPTFFNKVKTLWLMRRGVPSAGSIEGIILNLARGYLPTFYKVEVTFE